MFNFSFKEAIPLFFPKWKPSDYKDYQVDRYGDEPFVQLFFKKELYWPKILQQHHVKALMIYKQNKTYKLLYDYHFNEKNKKTPCLYMLFDNQYCLLNTTDCTQLPKEALRWTLPKYVKKHTLSEVILSLYGHVLSAEEKKACLNLPSRFKTKRKILSCVKKAFPQRAMYFLYVLSWSSPSLSLTKFGYVEGPTKKSFANTQLCVFFYFNSFYFMSQQDVLRFKCDSASPLSCLNDQQQQQSLKKEEEKKDQQRFAEFNQANRQMGLQLHLEGLTLAYYLGLLSKNTWTDVSDQCLQLQSYLFPHFSTTKEEKLVHIVYYNEITCLKGKSFYFNSKDTFGRFFLFLKNEQQRVSERKKVILSSLLTCLTEITCLLPLRHKWTLLLHQLQRYIKKLTCFFFDASDIFLLNVQLPFAYFSKFYYKQICRIQTSSTHTIIGLSTNFWSFQNITQWIGSDAIMQQTSISYQDPCMDWLQQCFPGEPFVYFPTPVLVDYCCEQTQDWSDWPYAFASILPMHYATTKQYCHARGVYRNQHIQRVVNQWLQLLRNKYQIDFLTSSFIRLPKLAFMVVMHQWFLSQPMSYHQSPEKMKPAYDQLLKSFCHGGFMYSCQASIQQGQPLFPQSESKVQTLIELDLISSYGSAASRLHGPLAAPGGFSQAYMLQQQQLQPCDTTQRHNTFEFKTVYAILHLLEANHWTLRSVFHNYSLLGLITIEHCPIDLVVVVEKPFVQQQQQKTSNIVALFLFQIDGIFIHGCPTCPPLPNYIGEQSHEQVRKKTTERDEKMYHFVTAFRTCFPHWLVDYFILRDCHTDYFSFSLSHQLFSTIPALKQLAAPYFFLKHFIQTTPIKHVFDTCPDGLTFIAICQLQLEPLIQSKISYLGGDYFWWGNNNNNNNSFDKWYFSNQPCGDVLMTKPLWLYLKTLFKINLLQISFIIFFRTCPFFSQTYCHFIEQRQQAACGHGGGGGGHCGGGQGLYQLFYKHIINLSTGYFAMSSQQQQQPQQQFKKTSQRTFSIHTQLCKKTVLKRATYFYSLGYFKKIHFHLRSKPCRSQRQQQQSTSIYLPYYIFIIEEGKRRLHECLYKLSAWTSEPYSLRLMYSNTDNLILAVTTATLEESQTSDLMCKQLLTTSHQPGYLEQKWTTSHLNNWIFISPKLCSYIVLNQSGDDGFSKFTSLNQCTLQELFVIAQSLLHQQPCTVTQQRRKHKLSNRSMVSVQYTLK